METTHDPWRGVSRTSFGLDYLKHNECPRSRFRKENEKDKILEFNHHDGKDELE